MTLQESATWREIMAQPDIWESWAAPLAAQADVLRVWMEDRAPSAVWLCGAGTSAFVGEVLAAGPAAIPLVPVATTDLVACPQDHLSRSARPLVVQFGRSGDSPESLGVLDLLDAHRPELDRLHITCNPAGALATRPGTGPGETRALVLPEATHDAGFAMTSSFTTMLLSALACLTEFDASVALPRLAAEARALLPALAERSAPRPARAVFLGSGALKGVARESALKVLELTAGRTVTQWDSPLGYRHGPKAAVDGDTAVFVLLHPDARTRRHDMDVAKEIAHQFPDIPVTTIGRGGDIAIAGTGEDTGAGSGAGSGEPRADAVLHVLVAQVLATRWSAALGLPVDDPFRGRNLSRVVSGVTLYPYAPAGPAVMICGGIDLGGTKIEARIFDGAEARTTRVRRIPTPLASFEAMAEGLAEQVRWLFETSGEAALPVGVAVPGLVDPVTGIGFASNVPTTGRALAPELARLTGRHLPVVNDCMAFAFSEANGGAGEGFASVMGLILGTGVGGGWCLDGRIPHRHAGLAVEVGHLGVSNRALARHGLPLWPCGCGRMGCVENYISGTGLANLAEWRLGRRLAAAELAASDDPAAAEVMTVWADIAGDVLHAIQIMLDPDVVVLGGGLSNLAGIETVLTESLARQRLGDARLPEVRRAAHGDTSGARGAALLARDDAA